MQWCCIGKGSQTQTYKSAAWSGKNVSQAAVFIGRFLGPCQKWSYFLIKKRHSPQTPDLFFFIFLLIVFNGTSRLVSLAHPSWPTSPTTNLMSWPSTCRCHPHRQSCWVLRLSWWRLPGSGQIIPMFTSCWRLIRPGLPRTHLSWTGLCRYPMTIQSSSIRCPDSPVLNHKVMTREFL